EAERVGHADCRLLHPHRMDVQEEVGQRGARRDLVGGVKPVPEDRPPHLLAKRAKRVRLPGSRAHRWFLLVPARLAGSGWCGVRPPTTDRCKLSDAEGLAI